MVFAADRRCANRKAALCVKGADAAIDFVDPRLGT
jgi:hypothetical protein